MRGGINNNIILMDSVEFKLWTPKDEINDFEPIVLEHIKEIFGKNSIYVGKKKIKTEAGTGSKPDGFVITLDEEPTCYVLEIEISNHNAYDHGVNQLSRIEDAIDNYHTHKEIINSIYENIKGTPEQLLIENKTNKELYKFLSDIITADKIKTVIVIENLTKEWETAFKRRSTKLVEFKTYARVRSDGTFIEPESVHLHFFNPIVKMDYQAITTISEEQPVQTTRIVRDEVHSLMEKEKTSSYARTGYTGKKIKSFEFNGKRYEVNGWIFMLLKISEEISRLNRKDLDKLLLLKGRKRPYFTKNKNELRGPEKINGTDIFVECNLNANSIVKLCEDILNLFDYKDNLKIETH